MHRALSATFRQTRSWTEITLNRRSPSYTPKRGATESDSKGRKASAATHSRMIPIIHTGVCLEPQRAGERSNASSHAVLESSKGRELIECTCVINMNYIIRAAYYILNIYIIYSINNLKFYNKNSIIYIQLSICVILDSLYHTHTSTKAIYYKTLMQR